MEAIFNQKIVLEWNRGLLYSKIYIFYDLGDFICILGAFNTPEIQKKLPVEKLMLPYS